jgi:protein TonB
LWLSLALHGAALAAVAVSWASTDTGAIEQPSEAITVEVIESTVLEALLVPPTEEAAASQSAAAPEAGNPEADQNASVAPTLPDSETERDDTVTKETPEADVAAAAPDEAPEADNEPAAREPNAPKEDAQLQDEQQDRPATSRPAKEPERREPQARQGGVTAKASAGSARQSGRVSASQGSILSYAQQVRARVAANKPSSIGGQGTVTIAFGVTPSGGLAYARVQGSSRVAALDQAALAAVMRAAPFPDPPAGASMAQLRFTIPLHFQ